MKHFLFVEQEEDGGRDEGGGWVGLTIAGWTDINFFKLMKVSIPLCYRGMSSIPGHPSNSITGCSNSSNSKSTQVLTLTMNPCFPFVFLPPYSGRPCYLQSCLTSSDVFTC